MSELIFDDLAPVSVPVTIGKKKCLLREASGDAACQYRNLLTAAARMNDGKVVGMHGVADAEPLLVSLCLFELYDLKGEQKERRFLLSEIRGWRSSVQRALFDKIKEISPGLDEKDTPETVRKRLETMERSMADGSETDRASYVKLLRDIVDRLESGPENNGEPAKNSPLAATSSTPGG